MDKLMLRFLRLFSGFFRRQGIDTVQLFDIVATKLMMDKRRSHFQFRQQSSQKNENGNRMYLVFFIYGIFSLFIAILLMQLHDIILAAIIFHSYLLFMMAMTLITDFSSVLLDTTDNMVILPRPVSSKTLFASRMLHIFIYLLQFGIAISAIPVVAMIIRFGLAPGLFSIVTSFSTILLSVFITYLLYLLILRFSSERKLKEIVTYFQIIMAVLFTGGYQVVPRLVDMSLLQESFSLQWYAYLLPPVWMAVALEAFQQQIYDWLHISMILLAVAVPALLFAMVNNYFAPAFSRKLAAVQDDGKTEQKTKPGQKTSPGLSEKLSRIVCGSAAERAGFELTWKITGRDKQFRLQFYPVIGYMIVFVFIIVFRSGRDVANTWEHLRESNSFLWFIYIPLFMITSSISFIAFNENYQAAWVYRSAPLQYPGHIIAGGLKALIVKFFVPIFLLLFAFCAIVWGAAVIDDFIFGLLVNINSILLMSGLSKYYLPFSQQPNLQQQSGRFVQVLLLVVLIALLAGLHWLGILFPIVMYILMPLAAATAFLLFRNVQRLPWRKIAI